VSSILSSPPTPAEPDDVSVVPSSAPSKSESAAGEFQSMSEPNPEEAALLRLWSEPVAGGGARVEGGSGGGGDGGGGNGDGN